MNLTSSFYRADEIKYKIDRVCGMCMFENKKDNWGKRWDLILELQEKLYEQFEINIE